MSGSDAGDYLTSLRISVSRVERTLSHPDDTKTARDSNSSHHCVTMTMLLLESWNISNSSLPSYFHLSLDLTSPPFYQTDFFLGGVGRGGNKEGRVKTLINIYLPLSSFLPRLFLQLSFITEPVSILCCSLLPYKVSRTRVFFSPHSWNGVQFRRCTEILLNDVNG